MKNCWSGLVIEQFFFHWKAISGDGMDICITDSTTYKSSSGKNERGTVKFVKLELKISGPYSNGA